ncbi:hypothetical protein PK35_14045 [Tamlana nanhaiensis]|uniref:Uncharacterized protein n=1 Tax=Neotamlana nanhaiensis TaxID=1382798 RepID=A0A0D7W0Z8_9FLAO|nr:T9SS type B sorting domain-containing protein [Tamlana nanhaiensis]KJD31527.1 hypothetical protein PK35_14045 [Tamlana nanhaiensis]
MRNIVLDCEAEIEDLLCFELKSYFTPNNDGVNDYWIIDAPVNCYFNIFIFDRYGKLLKMLTPKNNSWDGTYKGVNMPLVMTIGV